MEQIRRKYLNVLVFCGCFLGILAVAYVFIKYLLAPLLPFAAAYVIAVLIRPTVDRACKRSGLPTRAVTFLCVGFVFLCTFSVIGVLLLKMLSEVKELSGCVMGNGADIVNRIFEAAEELPILKDAERTVGAERIRVTVSKVVDGALSVMCQRIPSAVMGIMSSLPKVLLFSATLILATFYFGADVRRINSYIVSLFPKEKRQRIFTVKERLIASGIRYVRAYFIILALTFGELLVGFFILRIPYALTLAAMIALIDILPVLGVGTVLIPWSVTCFLLKDTRLGIGLLTLYGVVWVVRQIIEPKIIGRSVGIPPLLALAAMYTGYSLTGVGGLFLFPIAVTVAKSVLDALKEDKTEK